MSNHTEGRQYEKQGQAQEAFVCQGICKKYKDKEVLHDITLSLERGKIYGLIGRNGAGKTTLLSIMSAQNPATQGEALLDGERVWENPNALQKICFSRELNPMQQGGAGGMTVKAYLEAGSMYFPGWDKEMAQRLVTEFELEPKKKLIKLSKGMLSMLTIIIALASKAEFTLLDEPVAGLDVFMREKFYQLLLEEFMQTGRTFLISTHIIDEAAPVFEEVIMLKKGEIILKKNTEELLSKAVHVSGKNEDVDAATQGLQQLHVQQIGRRKEVIVFLEAGQEIVQDCDVTVKPVSLQNAFVALCGE